MDEECSAAVDIGAQQPKTFVGRVPRLDHNVVQFVAQEIFHHPLEARFHFQKIAQHADGSQSALHHAGLKEAAHRLGGVAVLIDNGFERSLSAERGGIFSAENVKMSLGLDLSRFFASIRRRSWLISSVMPLTRWLTVSNSSASWPRCPPKAST